MYMYVNMNCSLHYVSFFWYHSFILEVGWTLQYILYMQLRSAVKFLRMYLVGHPFLYQNCFVLGDIFPINHHFTFAHGGFMNNKLSPSSAIFITIITFIQNHHLLHYSQHNLALLLPGSRLPSDPTRYWITKWWKRHHFIIIMITISYIMKQYAKTEWCTFSIHRYIRDTLHYMPSWKWNRCEREFNFGIWQTFLDFSQDHIDVILL